MKTILIFFFLHISTGTIIETLHPSDIQLETVVNSLYTDISITDLTHPPTNQDITLITPSEQKEILTRTISILNENYVFPEVADSMVASLRERINRGEFAEAAEAGMFSERLTKHLYEISRDRHLWVMLSPGEYPEPQTQTTPEDLVMQRDLLRRTNFGFQNAKILAWNVGYLEVRNFYTPEMGGVKLQ